MTKSGEVWTPPKAANRITKLVDATFEKMGRVRFPLDVEAVALEAANIFSWSDPISRVENAVIKGFQGALVPIDDRKQWTMLYNGSMPSPGRVRFTQAHELGHYILHRSRQNGFHCADADVLGGPSESRGIENEADIFASYLLMPIDDFRRQIDGPVDLNLLSRCADRYGVSLTAAALKWVQFTDEKAVLIVSSEGFMHWSCSSDSAGKAGACFSASRSAIEVPQGTLAVDEDVQIEKAGREVPATTWFRGADPGDALREMKITMGQYDRTLTLLLLPRHSRFWETPYQHRA